MGYSDDTAEFMFTGRGARIRGPGANNFKIVATCDSCGTEFTTTEAKTRHECPTTKVRVACGVCGNSNITALAVDDQGWWFECRRCGHTTLFTDKQIGG